VYSASVISSLGFYTFRGNANQETRESSRADYAGERRLSAIVKRPVHALIDFFLDAELRNCATNRVLGTKGGGSRDARVGVRANRAIASRHLEASASTRATRSKIPPALI